jgi:beta-phosphoglucomutase-like phosphatase (HAD superfamily)
LGIGPETPVVTRKEVQRAKPDPDLFLAPAKKLSVRIHEAMKQL